MRNFLVPETILKRKFKHISWRNTKLQQAFGNPEDLGLWCVWGNSGNGKTSFVFQLAEELSFIDKVLINSKEEGTKATMQKHIRNFGLGFRNRRIRIGCCQIEELIEELSRPRSAKYVIIDSAHAMGLKGNHIKLILDRFPKKLFIIISRAEKEQPKGSIGEYLKSEADLKIQVKGFKAISHGRHNPGGEFVIWPEGAVKFWGTT